MNEVSSDPITRILQEVVQPNAEANRSLASRPTSARKWVFLCPDGAASGNESELFPYSISGFIAEPSQSAQRPRANPAAVQSVGLRPVRGTSVCVLFCEYRRTARCGSAPRAVRPRASNGDAGRTFTFPPCRLTVQDPGLSSRGMRVRLPSGRPFSLRKRRFLIRNRSSLRPIGSE